MKIDIDICHRKPFIQVLNTHNIIMLQDLPIGVIIAKCNLVDCQKIKENDGICTITEGHLLINGNEYEFGDYTPGRWSWLLEDIQPVEPIPAKGHLGLWKYDGEVNYGA